MMNGIALITIWREAKANSLPKEDKAALAREIDMLSGDSAVRAIVITGAGDRAFCAGSDIDEMRQFGPHEMQEMLSSERAMYLSALRCPKPIVAAVNGVALGAGLILAMSCDYTVASKHASFGTPELTIGVAVPLEGFLLPYLIGLARARAMYFTGARVSADEATSIGLINEVTEHETLIARSLGIARQMADLPARGFQIQKALLHRLVSTGDLEGVIEESHDLTSQQFAEPEVGEAMNKFLSGKTRGGRA